MRKAIDIGLTVALLLATLPLLLVVSILRSWQYLNDRKR